ncbi:MAG: hypothetical protein JWP01_1754 [Myxococcales bacterium]|nr:hypothetical protein [Myxococcales bacterium]
MMTHRLLAPVLAACASLAAFTGCTTDDGFVADASLRVVNNSDFVIEQIYLTDTGSSTWGPNLLGGDVLFPDEELLLGVNCDFYDALLVDEDGVECEINDIDLCLNDATWSIRNNTCTVFGVAAKERAEKAAAQQQTEKSAN